MKHDGNQMVRMVVNNIDMQEYWIYFVFIIVPKVINKQRVFQDVRATDGR